MAGTARIGRQEPTQAVILPFSRSLGDEALTLYRESGREAFPWQELIETDVMAVDDAGDWIHAFFGLEVPRQNGKGEILIMRELWGIKNSETILHTAHRSATSHKAYEKLKKVMDDAGYIEMGKMGKNTAVPPKAYKATKQFGLESIQLLDEGGGIIYFRTRSELGGLGESFDLLIIDEAQDYTQGQQGALQYTIAASPKAPQTIMTGTPPTLVSRGTVFAKRRRDIISGAKKGGWAEWSVYKKPENLNDRDLWYEANPSLGLRIRETTVAEEDQTDQLDFLIQRLGFWHEYKLKSEITAATWNGLKIPGDKLRPRGKLFAAIKYGADGVNVSLAIAVKQEGDAPIFCEVIDCQSRTRGNDWILRVLKNAELAGLVIDGRSGQSTITQAIADESTLKRLKVIEPTAGQAVEAYAVFRQAVDDKALCHAGQPSLAQAVANCEKRLIGTNGAFGFRSLEEGVDISLVESVALAYWLCKTVKERRKQRVQY